MLSQVSPSRRNQLFFNAVHIHQKIPPYLNRKNTNLHYKLHINRFWLSSFLCAYVEHVNPLEMSECDTCDSKKSKLRLEGARYAHVRTREKDTKRHKHTSSTSCSYFETTKSYPYDQAFSTTFPRNLWKSLLKA